MSPNAPAFRNTDRLFRWTSGVMLCGFAMMQVGPAWGGPPPSVAPGDELQLAPGDELRIVTVDTSAFPDVTATVALPPSARDLADASDSFLVSSAGVDVPANVERLPAEREPVAILIDNADGTGEALFGAQVGAAAELVRQLDPASPIVIGSSVGGAVFGPDADREGSLAALGRLRLGGLRDWPRTLSATLDVVAQAPRATVIVVSAGRSIETSDGPSVLSARLAGDAVRVRWISLRSAAGPVGELQGITWVVPARTDGLLARLDSIGAGLVAQYRLTFRVDPRAIATTITLVAGGRTWAAETPLPLPSPVYIDQSPRPTVLSASASPQDRTDSDSSSLLESVADALNRNPVLVIIGSVVTLILGAALLLRSAED